MPAKPLLFFFLLLLIYVLPAICEEIPVRVKAENLKYDQEIGIITASGSVEITFEDFIIRSDSARVDINANIATAEGNVKIDQKNYSIRSSFLTYDISKETSVVIKLKTVFYPTDIKANLYMSAEKLYDLTNVKKGEYGSLTTCDYDSPHYNVSSRWFDYYPDDKLVGYLVTLYVGPVPILWTPYYIYNLKKHRTPFSFIYGENAVEGKFLKTSFDYFINNEAYGIFYFDTTKIKGPGYGVQHEYKLNNENSGTLYLYTMEEKDTKLNDYVVKLTHEIRTDEYSKLTLLHDSAFIYQIPAGRKYSTLSSVGYSRNTGTHILNYNYSSSDNMISYQNTRAFNICNSYAGANTSFKWDESRAFSGQKWKSAHDTFHHDQPVFTDNAKFETNINYSSYVTDEGFIADEKLEPRVDFTYKGTFYSMKVTQNWYEDIDGKNYTGDDRYEYLERLPEMTLTFIPVDLYYFTLSSNVGYAIYHEAKYFSLPYSRMRHVTTNRNSIGANLSRSDNLGLGTVLRSGIGVDQYEYGLGDQRYQLRESLNMETNLWGFFRNNVDRARARVDGHTPFFFESLGSQYNYLKEKITLYYQDKASFDIGGGYNYMNNRNDDIMGNLHVTPNEQLSFHVSAGWSVEELRYRDLIASCTVIPFPKFVNTASWQVDMNTGTLLSANSLVDLEIGDSWESRWHFKMGHSYDFFEDRYMLRDLGIVKDLHCWEAVFTYNDFRKEYRFGMTLKAFPDMPFSYVASETGNYFDSFMNNMHFEQESPRRY